MLIADAKVTFDRTKFGISYKSKSLMGDLADKFIEDEVTLDIKIKMEA